MTIKERKQITGTTAQIQAYAGHEGQIVWDKEKKTFVGMSGTAGTNYPLASKEYVDNEVAKKANLSHTHKIAQITDMPRVVLSVNNITPNDSGNVHLGLHDIAKSGNYNDLTNKPYIPVNTSNWSASGGDNGWARDNSTGFTIVWGSADPGAWTSFARTFDSVLAVSLGPWGTKNYSWGNELNNSGFKHNSNGWSKYIAVGFS